MSCPQSRPNIDLDTSRLRTPILAAEDSERKAAPRSTPSRLQHSPSLPNIWFPPHSGPIPPEMSKAQGAGTRFQAPSAPPSPEPSLLTGDSQKEVRAPNRHVKYASIDPVPTVKSNILKTHARRRTERDQPHSLLTPPLTPSSSIQTSASHDSSAGAHPSDESDETPSFSEEILDPDMASSRILLLENVNPQLSVEELKSAIIDSLLTHSSEENAVDDHTKAPILQLLRRDPLKGINGKHLERGIIPVVFFDVRVAKVARKVLSNCNEVRLSRCVGDDIDDRGERRWLSARLVTVDELSKSLGHSPFLDGVNGSFTMTLELVPQNKENINNKPTSSLTESAHLGIKFDFDEGTISRGPFNISIVQNIVKSYGTVRLFNFARHETDLQNNPSLVYNVEYYDSREAEEAFEDLSNKIMFGMKIKMLRKINPQASGPLQTTLPFPNTSTAGESFGGLISPARSQTQYKQRTFHLRQEGTKAEQGQGNLSSPSSPRGVPAGGSSPPLFYTSTPPFAEFSDPSILGGQGHGTGSAPHLTQHTHSQGPLWPDGDQVNLTSGLPCYAPDGACFYCPSRGPLPYTPGFAHYAMSPASPGAIYYPAPAGMTQMPNMVNVGTSPNQGTLIYDYVDPQQSQPVPNTGACFDPAIAAIGAGPIPLMPMMAPNIASPLPYTVRDDLIPMLPGQVYQPGFGQSPNQNLVQPQIFTDNTSRSSASLSKAIANIAKHDSASLVKHDAGSGQNERNQLNIARIEDGLDTRTTVMIKNIPNKMSDVDLTEYIAKVCPRRIDFLYLRMDFKNGCNVGYAFVNFITVEDLLHFAKERLGAKWNMFSSEKVLQMSYANYQGKEALVEKFRNSAIMDERESWRPRIFYSSGSQQGLLEPFPPPTHIRRKERSSYNRGTLFPPNTHSNSILHNNPANRRYNENPRLRQYRPNFIDDNASHIGGK